MHTVTALTLKNIMAQQHLVLLGIRTLNKINTCMIENSVHILSSMTRY